MWRRSKTQPGRTEAQCPKSRRRDGGSGEAATRHPTIHAYLDRLTAPSDSMMCGQALTTDRSMSSATRRSRGRLDIIVPITKGRVLLSDWPPDVRSPNRRKSGHLRRSLKAQNQPYPLGRLPLEAERSLGIGGPHQTAIVARMMAELAVARIGCGTPYMLERQSHSTGPNR